MTFGKRLHELRNKCGLTQPQLADKLNVGRAIIGLYESDKRQPSIKVLIEISDYFGVSTDYLLRGKESITEESMSEELEEFIARYHQLNKVDQEYLLKKSSLIIDLISKL